MIFSLARTVPGYQLLFRELFEVCTRKKHVRPLKTRAWNGSERENDEEEGGGGGGERSGEAGCLKVPKRARKRDKGPAGIIDAGTRRDERERPWAPRAHVDRRRTARVPGSFSREERRRTRNRKRERVRRGNRWMGLAAYPANAPSDIAVTLL